MNPFKPSEALASTSDDSKGGAQKVKRFPWLMLPAMVLAILATAAAGGIYWQAQKVAGDLASMPSKFQASNDSLVQSQQFAALTMVVAAAVALASAAAERLQQRTLSIVGIVLCLAIMLYVAIQFKPG